MKKQILTSVMVVSLLAGCATHTVSSKSTDTAGTVTENKEKTQQGDNAVLGVVGQGVKILGDVLTAILPPIVTTVTKGVTKPVVAPAPATP